MIARNLYRDSLRTRQELPLESGWLIEDERAGPEAAAAAPSELRVVLDALRAFDLSVAAVKVRVHRARVKLNAARSAKEHR